MAKTKFSNITLELVVESSDVQPVKKLLGEALDTIHENHTLFRRTFPTSVRAGRKMPTIAKSCRH
jgi:flagellar motor component MotA